MLADDVLPLIRTRAYLDWDTSTTHGGQMHQAVDVLEAALDSNDPREVYQVAHKALASAMKVIARADDSNGVIGDACRRLLAIHPVAAARAQVAPSTLVTWMIKFQFDESPGFFELDVVDYAAALGKQGIAKYRTRLAEIAATLEPRSENYPRGANSSEWFQLEWNAKRLAVLDRDVGEIIRTHAGEMKVAAQLENVSRALEEVGEFDLAIDWAKRATLFDTGFQALHAGSTWCRLVDEHRPEGSLEVRLTVFRRWPTHTSAAALLEASGAQWSDYRDEVMAGLSAHPREAVNFALHELNDATHAWELANSLALTDIATWSDLLKVYEKIDPAAALPVHRQIVDSTLKTADARNYRSAALRLRKMRKLAINTPAAAELDAYIVALRKTHSRRKLMHQAFDQCKLP